MNEAAIERGAISRLQEDLGGEADVIADLIQTYLLEGPRMVRLLRNGFETNNVVDVNRAAHSMKSTAATFGALRLSQLCREMEQLSMGGRMPGDAATRVADVEREWARVRAELEAWRPTS